MTNHTKFTTNVLTIFNSTISTRESVVKPGKFIPNRIGEGGLKAPSLVGAKRDVNVIPEGGAFTTELDARQHLAYRRW